MTRVLPLSSVLAALACDDGGLDLERMRRQEKVLPYAASSAFQDDMGMRRPPEGTVHRGANVEPGPLRDGRENGAYVASLPLPVNPELLRRGQDRFFIFCAVCHGTLGDGQSRVADNMLLRRPPSLHEARLRAYPPGRIYEVITEGYGLMPAYASELPVRDRWAVVAYVGALQLSQSVPVAELPPGLGERAKTWLK